MSPDPRRLRVAVLAVHGVADQAPDSSARQIASLLANIDDGERPVYGPLAEETIRVPVRPLDVPRRAAFASAHANGTPIEHRFMEGQLAEFQGGGPDATYQTVRLSGARTLNAAAIDVDVYEMYWADLSRLGTSWWRILGEFYQLLLHIGSLAKHTARASALGDERWVARVFDRSVALASWILAAPIAILNLQMLVGAGLILASLLPAPAQLVVSLVVATLSVIVAIGFILMRWSKAPFASRMAGLLIPAGMTATAVYFLREESLAARFNYERLLGIEVMVLGLLATSLLLNAYRRHRPGSGWVGVLSGGVVLASGVWALSERTPPVLVITGVKIIESLFLLLHLSWGAFLVVLWTSMVAGWVYGRTADAARQERAGRAVTTARVALVVPAGAFIVVTVSLWGAINVAVHGTFRQSTYTVAAYAQGILPGVETVDQFIQTALVNSLGNAFLVAAGVVAIAVILAVWAVAPIVWSEVRPPRTNARCAEYGAWLNAGFPMLRWAGHLAVLAFTVIMPAPAILALADVRIFETFPSLAGSLGFLRQEPGNRAAIASLIQQVGVAIAIPAAGLLVFSGRLKSLAGGFRAPLDVLLDVDGYLREHPRQDAPRARLCARYWSLLRHLAACQPRYDALVIIAHSQGTVLTADLLRYLTFSQQDTGLPRIHLFTMGSPLRQLYSERFADLYDWARNGADTSPNALAVPDIAPETRPLPSDLGVECWVNAYRSGDYVGRWLWRPDHCSYQFEAAPLLSPWKAIDKPLDTHSRDETGSRRELCIGAGAHTHYWDATAPEVALELDLMIRRAAGAVPPVG
jgi:hypothetical protein